MHVTTVVAKANDHGLDDLQVDPVFPSERTFKCNTLYKAIPMQILNEITHLFKKALGRVNKRYAIAAYASLFVSEMALAGGAAGGTDFLGEIGTQISGGLTLVLSIVKVVVIFIMIFAVLYKFSEASRGRATWAEALIPLIGGAVMLAFIGVIEPDATAAIAEIGGGAAQ